MAMAVMMVSASSAAQPAGVVFVARASSTISLPRLPLE
jgi:hypothetical protein